MNKGVEYFINNGYSMQKTDDGLIFSLKDAWDIHILLDSKQYYITDGETPEISFDIDEHNAIGDILNNYKQEEL